MDINILTDAEYEKMLELSRELNAVLTSSLCRSREVLKGVVYDMYGVMKYGAVK